MLVALFIIVLSLRTSYSPEQVADMVNGKAPLGANGEVTVSLDAPSDAPELERRSREVAEGKVQTLSRRDTLERCGRARTLRECFAA